MSTKEELLNLFEQNKGIYLSGEEIADSLDISRTAVWKAVNSLRNDGYDIDAQKTKGYCLSPMTDIVSAQGVNKYLRAGLDVEVFPEPCIGDKPVLVMGIQPVYLSVFEGKKGNGPVYLVIVLQRIYPVILGEGLHEHGRQFVIGRISDAKNIDALPFQAATKVFVALGIVR